MSRLYCRLDTDAAKHQVTRRGHHEVSSALETWDGGIRTILRDNGNFEVWLCPKWGETLGTGTLIHTGNVNGG